MVRRLLLIGLLSCLYFRMDAMPQLPIELIKNGRSSYQIVLSAAPTKKERQAAEILQTYLSQVCGARLPIVGESPAIAAGIYVGNTDHYTIPRQLKDESYVIRTDERNVFICGRNGSGVIYGVCAFLEQYAGCFKGDALPVSFTRKENIIVPAGINEISQPSFLYREAYYPMSEDPLYLQWHGLHRLEDLWGLWGHSFEKLVPAARYFKEHPDYYAYVNGKRQPTQLCLSNNDVYKIVAAELKRLMAKNPDAIYWSIAPNDQGGYCQCKLCKKADDADGGPTGSLVRFVNRIAAGFPEQKFTTLAYQYTSKPPAITKPLGNVYVFVSNIDAYKDLPLAKEPSAAPFVRNLKKWTSITPNIFVWDYGTQFTNYLAPFPNIHTLSDNFRLYKEHNVKGVFLQGSGTTYSDFAELRSYIYSRLLWNARTDVETETAIFINKYYGPAAPFVHAYYKLLTASMYKSGRKLDIYGNPVNEWDSYLSPEMTEAYYALLDKAEANTSGQPVYRERVARLRLSINYTVLQQSRFYGTGKHGMYSIAADRYVVKKTWTAAVKKFVAEAKKSGVAELSEGGLTPDEYGQEWERLFNTPYTVSKALNANVKLRHPYSEYYPARGAKTLVDGVHGYADYSYNWLIFYGQPLIAEIKLPAITTISEIKLSFLHDPRHQILSPDEVSIAVSTDGKNYTTATINTSEQVLNSTVKKAICSCQYPLAKIRHIKIEASLRDYNSSGSAKKMSIAADEVFVK